MEKRPVVSREEWLAARKAHLVKEKELSRARDALALERRTLPWMKIDKTYVFDGPNGPETLSDLFGRNSQLIVYHFMFQEDWKAGCPACSFLSDHIDGANLHLAHHDVSVVAVSRAPRALFEPYKRRMTWRFKWVSSHANDFNQDFQVTATPAQKAAGTMIYNYADMPTKGGENPGLSVFYKDEAGDIFHTYSSYGRGLDLLVGAYNWLELTPKGRNEQKNMDWMKRHDEYGKMAAE